MNASVAPISFETSISSRRVRICRRMVLKVTATSPAPSSALRAARSPPGRYWPGAARRRAQAASACTCATPGSPASSPASCPMRFPARRHHEGVGQRVAAERRDQLGHALHARDNSLSACSRGTKRTCAIRRSARSVVPRASASVRFAPGCRNTEICGSSAKRPRDAAQVLEQRIAARGRARARRR